MPYDETLVAPLPIQALPTTIEIAPPIDAAALSAPATPDASGFSGPLPGMGGDVSNFTGMDLALFCNIMDQSLAQGGMTRSQYIDLMNQVMGFVPADEQANMQQFLDMLNSCP